MSIQNVKLAASTPSIRPQAAGQHWLACTIYPRASGADPHSVADQEGYDGAPHNALSTGRERNRIGTCIGSSDLNNGGIVGCGTVHRSEIFASGAPDSHSSSGENLQRSRTQVVQRLTGLSNFTTVGLTVQVLTTDYTGTNQRGFDTRAVTNLICAVNPTGQRALASSLFPWGNKPIPWGPNRRLPKSRIGPPKATGDSALRRCRAAIPLQGDHLAQSATLALVIATSRLGVRSNTAGLVVGTATKLLPSHQR